MTQGTYNTTTGVWNVGTLSTTSAAPPFDRLTATVLASGNYTNTATKTASTPADPNAT